MTVNPLNKASLSPVKTFHLSHRGPALFWKFCTNMATLIIFYGHRVRWDLSTWPNKPHDSYLDLKKRHQHLHEPHRTHSCLLKLSMDNKYISKWQHILLPHKVHTSKPAWPCAPGLSASGLESPLERLWMTQRARGTAVTTDALIVILRTQREKAGVMVKLQRLDACDGARKGFWLSQTNNFDVFSCVKLSLRAIFPLKTRKRKYRRKKMYKKEKVHNFKTLH